MSETLLPRLAREAMEMADEAECQVESALHADTALMLALADLLAGRNFASLVDVVPWARGPRSLQEASCDQP